MVAMLDNPMGFCGFEFIAFSAPHFGLLERDQIRRDTLEVSA
jgi:hypothetical protein